MGNCASCLGSRRRDDYDEDDEAQHLFDDPNNLQYGSFEQQQMMGPEDPQEVQREIEALQRVVARTSDNMVDIYDIAPSNHRTASPSAAPDSPEMPYAYPAAAPDANLVRYHNLLSKLSSHDDLAAVARVDWGTPDDDTIEMQQNTAIPIKLEGATEPLVGNFADAAAAMR
ncbi:uncharacterized protein PODANS_4_5160 [Podospora anserina S mat+]|uniref:Podospora anserina S mat+ genomic DNA chromosome 4, supercontig 4 n=1 Tax=Podospora anserina (strain S / ATCC MYA-4624 / DSM 980 / FGSC 10383) TaxID=515849 RepID=B2AQ67_PODAN|nr:uncharacterized protein PODANS_4_5160 [Podospora anserina S mat+]CAP67006.1 unnamed protein product [Podospora anserina S mat+]CDP28748.1 Putative protein of unknown function [Podospora anserina S mat+]